MSDQDANPDFVVRLSRDLRAIGELLERDEVRELVELYYRLQEHRIALGNQHSSLAKAERTSALVSHFHDQVGLLERQVVSVLDRWTDTDVPAKWAKSQLGIGPVLAAGCCAHIDIERAPTAGSIWRFFGLDPTVTWEKGQKRPWNAEAKVLAWKIGDSFVKVSGRENAYYGKLYRKRKDYELERDARNGNVDAARRSLERRNITDKGLRATLESGHLPAGQLDMRARRYATKLFLAHLHHVMFLERYGEPPSAPYPIAHLGHVHYLEPPGLG